MKLLRLRVRRMPGIDDGFAVDGLADGCNLIVGPNGSGKTTLCRAFRAVLWPSTESDRAIAVELDMTDGSRRWIGTREATETRWQRDGEPADPPALPNPNAARCFTLGFRDLLSEGRTTDDAVAREVRRQMAGGFDVHAVREEAFSPRPRHGGAEEARLRERIQELTRIRGEQTDLADREERLLEIDADLEVARGAAARLETLRTAAELRRTRDELQSIRSRLETLPPGLARLSGNERSRIEELDADEARLREELSRCRTEIDEAEAVATRSVLPRGPVDESILEGQAARVRQLQQRAAELTTAKRLAEEARATREEAARGLDAQRPDGLDPVIDLSVLGEIESFLDRATEIRSERRRLDADRGSLSSRRPETPSRELDQAVRCLDAWLDARTGQRSVDPRHWFLLLGAALVAVAPVVGWLGEGPAAVALAAAGAVTLLFTAMTGGLRGRRAAAEAHRSEFERLGVEAPASWDPDSVERLRRRLQQQWADSAYREREQQRLEELDVLEAELERREQALAEERETLRRQTGVDPGLGDLDLARLARAIAVYQTASIEHRKAQAAWEQAEHEQAKLLERIGSFAREHGVASPEDVSAASAAVEDVAERSRKLRDARIRRSREERRLEQVEQRIAECRGRRDRIFLDLDLQPGDDATLDDWLAGRDDHRSRLADAEQLERSIGKLEQRLSDRAELAELPREEIERLILEAEASAARMTRLIEDRTRTREAVRSARQGKALESATARVEEARHALEQRLDEALFGAAGRFLLDDVSAQFERQSRPEILARAAGLFERFTHHRYELRVESSTERPEFRAVESETGAGRSMAELSDATRVQLLLAARLAYAFHTDRETRLPLLLDEVLTTTDPERFVAVVESLLEVARDEGRQLLYLTANPADVVQWNRLLGRKGLELLTPIDLAAVRNQASSAEKEEPLELPALPEVPEPTDGNAERYGRLIEVPGIDLQRPVASLHLFHLLREELDLLYALLVRRIRTVGQWRRLAAGGGAESLMGRDAAARISALADLATAFFDAWRVGHSRPIDTGVLRDAGLSDVWIDRLGSLLEEQDGDPAVLIDELARREDERTKGFRGHVLERLREFLLQHDYLDERQPLDEAAIHSRVQVAVAAHVQNRLIRAEEVAARVHELQQRAGVHA